MFFDNCLRLSSFLAITQSRFSLSIASFEVLAAVKFLWHALSRFVEKSTSVEVFPDVFAWS